MTARSRGPRRAGVLARLRPGGGERPVFLEGLAIGAIVGAAIAGSTLWSRLRTSRRDGVAPTEPQEPPLPPG